MKEQIKTLLFIIAFSCIFSSSLFAQGGYLHGKVLSTGNIPLQGASVLIKNTNSGTSTDGSGVFVLKIGNQKKIILVVTYIGYLKKEIEVNTTKGDSIILIQLEEKPQELDDVVITGVFNPLKRIESSNAITTIKNDQIQRIIPNSAAELLRLVPGVFVNSARGEIVNNIFSRGMVLDGSSYYVSIQEDGLPVIPFSGTLGATAFLRADISIQKIEALRGGSASILGVNAPGGIFNYISKKGTNKFEGNIVSRVGLEGNGKNPYYKLEMSLSGPLIKKDSSSTYFLGGHYRYANGAKYPGYPLSRGGQLKGNIEKTYSSGSIRLNIKWLDDRSSSFEFTPSKDFDHPHPSGNFDNTSSVLIPSVHQEIPSVGEGIRAVDFNSKNLDHLQEKSIGLRWEQRFNKSWKMQHAIRFSDKSSETNGTVIVYPFQINTIDFYILNGLFFNTGKYRFFDARSGQNYGTVTYTQDFTQPDPFMFTSDLHLPGSEVSPNSLFFTPVNYDKTTLRDMVYQGSVTKNFKNMKFTGGLFLSKGRYKSYSASLAQGYTTIENKPHLVAIEYTPENGGPVYKITDEKGIGLYGPAVIYNNDIRLSQNAAFFGHQWDITPKLNLDWGFRYEWFSIDNTFTNFNSVTPSTDGGIDHDPLTFYDNNIYTLNALKRFKKSLSTFSISGGLNYKVNDHLAYYVRYSLGNRTPDVSTYVANQDAASVVKEQAQRTVQFEGGIKYETEKIRFTATPFVSILSNVPQTGFGSDTGSLSSYYPTPVIYNKVHTIGIELEGTMKLLSHFNIRANAVFQQFYADKFQFYDLGADNGPQDDFIIDRSGKKISDMAAPVIFNITPSYSNKKWYADINMYYLGKRAANTSETFYLNAFTQFDLHIAYAISKNISLQAAVNNVFNKFGVMEWTAPITGGFAFFSTFNTQQFTPDKRIANPDANYFTIAIQPRSYFLTLSVKF